MTVVPPFQLTFSDEMIAEFAEACSAILRSGVLTLASWTQEFEGLVASMAGTRHAVAVTSGTTALELAIVGLDPGAGAVLIPNNTNPATAAAIVAAGRPIQLYDAGLWASAASISEAITEDTAAVMVVHIGGYVSPEIDEIAALCRDHALPLIEDAAHAHGSSHQGRPAGSLGDVAGFSFFPTKVVTTAEGGAITCDDDQLAARARELRNQGKGAHELRLIGGSFRMSEFSAALGAAQMRRLEATQALQAEIFSNYDAALGNQSRLVRAYPPPGGVLSGYKYVVLADKPDTRGDFVDFCRSRGVSLAGDIYEKLISDDRRFDAQLLPNDRIVFREAEDFASRHICLPAWPLMSQDCRFAVEAALSEF